MAAILTIEGLKKSFDGVKAVHEFSLGLEQGQIISLIGPNGAGKTTLFNLIGGFITPDQGDIFFRGKRISGLSPFRVANLGITRLFQNLRLIYKVPVLENILLAFRSQKGEQLMQALFGNGLEERRNIAKTLYFLDLFGLREKADEVANDLSYGQQKLLALAVCLATGGDLFLLDEPLAGLHPDMIGKVKEIIKELKIQGKTVFFIEHHLEAAIGISDMVVVMDGGRKIAMDTPQGIYQDPRVIEAYLT